MRGLSWSVDYEIFHTADGMEGSVRAATREDVISKLSISEDTAVNLAMLFST